jgi:CubicO group peptidase (beta-lactamase class C family)
MVTVDPIDCAMQEAVDNGVFPGAVLAVRCQGTTVYEKAVGRLSTIPEGPAVTSETVYDLASLTKPLATTTATLLFVQRQRIDLEEPIENRLTELCGSAIGKVSLVHLLTHSSGLPGWRPYYEWLEQESSSHETMMDRGQAQATVLRYLGEETLIYPPGTRSLYSDLGFMLIGFLLERISGSSLADLCMREVFVPLGAKPLAFLPVLNGRQEGGPFGPAHPVAATENDPWRKRTLHGEVHDENAFALGGIAGHAGLFGTAGSVLALSSAWLNAYHGTTSLFEPDRVRQFVARRSDIPDSSRAFGWDTPSVRSNAGTYFSKLSFGHLGYTGTSLWIDPTCRLEVVLLSNRVHPTRRNEAIREFRPRIHELIYKEVVGAD